jgi:calcium channel MID1
MLELGHAEHPLKPVLGDTTSTVAIVLSPPFAQAVSAQMTYPNYTLSTTVPASEIPRDIPKSSVIVFDQGFDYRALSRSSCALRERFRDQIQTFNVTTSSVLRNRLEGWISEFVIQNLTPATNYTVFLTQGPKVSGPLRLLTKTATFPCTMAHDIPYCPGVSYSIPLLDPLNTTLLNSSQIPSAVVESVTTSLENFKQTLSTFPCGRDTYSPLKTCSDCFYSYRDWLCAISFPRCAEPLIQETHLELPLKFYSPDSPSRATGFPALGVPHNEIQPCIEICYSVLRSCPPFIGWQCPSKENAKASYGVGFIDSSDGQKERAGVTGRAYDEWGNIWCNNVGQLYY